MFGTITLAEVNSKLIARFGCLPDLSDIRKKLAERRTESANHELSELEKELNARMDELERIIRDIPKKESE